LDLGEAGVDKVRVKLLHLNPNNL